jgi:hypothetical protein
VVSFLRPRRASVLILVVVLLVLLFLIGTGYLATARIDRYAAVQNRGAVQTELAADGVRALAEGAIIDALQKALQEAGPVHTSYLSDAFLAQRTPLPFVPFDPVVTPYNSATNPATWYGLSLPLIANGPDPDSSIARYQFDDPATGVPVILPLLGEESVSKTGYRFVPTLLTAPPYVNNDPNWPHLRVWRDSNGDGLFNATDAPLDGALIPAADADGDGIADAGLWKLPLGTIGGITYYAAVRIIDNNSAINASTSMSRDADLDGAMAVQADVGAYPTYFGGRVGLLEMLRDRDPGSGMVTANDQINDLNELRLGGMATYPADPVLDDTAVTQSLDFDYLSFSDALQVALGRRLGNPGRSDATPTSFVAPPSSDLLSLAYRFVLQNPLGSSAQLEQTLGPSLLFTADPANLDAGKAVRQQPYLGANSVDEWFQENFNFSDPAGILEQTGDPRTYLSRRSMTVARSPVSNQAPVVGSGLPNTLMAAYAAAGSEARIDINQGSFPELFRAFFEVMAEDGSTSTATTPFEVEDGSIFAGFAADSQYDPYHGNVFDQTTVGWPSFTAISRPGPIPVAGPRQHPQRMFRSSLRAPMESVALGFSSKTINLTPSSQLILRSAIATANAMELRDQDFDITPQTISIPVDYTPGGGSGTVASGASTTVFDDIGTFVAPVGFAGGSWYLTFTGGANAAAGFRQVTNYAAPTITVGEGGFPNVPAATDTFGVERRDVRSNVAWVVDAGSTTTDIIASGFVEPGGVDITDGTWKLRLVSGAIAYEEQTITAYDPNTDTITCASFSAAPTPGDTFEIFRAFVGSASDVVVYGLEPQPFITEVFAHAESGYVAVELHNPYAVPMVLTNCRLARINRNAGQGPGYTGGGYTLTSVADFANVGEVVAEKAPLLAGYIPAGGYLVLQSAAGGLPAAYQAGGIPAAANVATVPNLAQLLADANNGQELVLLRPTTASLRAIDSGNDGTADDDINNSGGFDAADVAIEYTTSTTTGGAGVTPAANDMVPLDQFDFTGLAAAVAPAGEAWHYVRANDSAAGKAWHFVYPGRYDGAAGVASVTVGTRSTARQQGTVSAGYYGADPGPVAGSPAVLLGAADAVASYPQTFPIQLSNMYWPGNPNTLLPSGVAPWLPGVPFGFPFGGFVTNGDITKVPFIGSYVIAPAAGTVFEMNSVTMDAAMAEDTSSPTLGVGTGYSPEDRDGNGALAADEDVNGNAALDSEDAFEQIGRFAPWGENVTVDSFTGSINTTFDGTAINQLVLTHTPASGHYVPQDAAGYWVGSRITITDTTVTPPVSYERYVTGDAVAGPTRTITFAPDITPAPGDGWTYAMTLPEFRGIATGGSAITVDIPGVAPVDGYWNGAVLTLADPGGAGVEIHYVTGNVGATLTFEPAATIPVAAGTMYILERPQPYAWARDLYDHLTVQSPADDYLAAIARQTEWVGGRWYEQNALVENDGDLYQCTLAHLSVAGSPPSGGGSWALIRRDPVSNSGGKATINGTVVTAGAPFDGSNNLSDQDDEYNGLTVLFTSGTLEGQKAEIDAYLGGTRTITLAGAAPPSPAIGDTFKIIGEQAEAVEGLININTASWKVLASLPLVVVAGGTAVDPVATEQLAQAIVYWRDVDCDPTAGVRPHGPFKSLNELLDVIDLRAGGVPVVTNADYGVDGFRNGMGTISTAISINPLVTEPNAAQGDLSGADLVRGDSEERNLALARISNLVTTRSDSFTCYIVLQGWRNAGTPQATLETQRRVAVQIDRSHMTAGDENVVRTLIPSD